MFAIIIGNIIISGMEIMQQKISPNKKQIKVLTIPNILSLFRICLIPVITWLYCVIEEYDLAGYVLILSGVTDIVDGFIARHFNMVSDLGKMLDPVADKLTQAAMIVCLVVRFPLMILLFALMLAKETFMAVLGFTVVKKTGVVISASWHGKVATLLLYSMMLLHLFWSEITPLASFVSIALCAIMICVSFLLYGIKLVKMIIKAKKM